MRRFFAPQFTLPVIVLLVAGIAGVAAVLAAKDTVNRTDLVIQSCNSAEDPNCTLRQPTHEHADFALFIRGERFDFNQPEFLTEEGESPDHPFLHIHPERYSVVHVHMSGSTWAEFLEALGFKLTDPTLVGTEAAQTCMSIPDDGELCNTDAEQWRFFRNGVEVDGLAYTEIQDLERVLVTYGELSEDEIEEQLAAVSDQSCILSGYCKDREIPGETETCAGQGTCTD
jgi:hypothetical protein